MEKPDSSATVNCLKCTYFYVTWDNHFPRGCKLFGFKAKHLPSQSVYEATGKPCEHFTDKGKSEPKR